MNKAKKPNFFILGAPKCGTTALSQYLAGHPNIYMSNPKEPNFFTRDFPVYQKHFDDIHEYERLFDPAENHHYIIGEASVWYLYTKSAVPEILENYPDAKFIALVRNPVDMATSLHSQMLLMREESVSDFYEAWCLQQQRSLGEHIPTQCREPTFLQYRNVCKLGEQTSRLLDITGGKNTMIVYFDDMIRNARSTYVNILKFLGIEDDRCIDFPVINANRVFRSSIFQYALLRAPSLIGPIIKPLKRKLGIKRFGLLEKATKLNMKAIKRDSIADNTRNLVLADFEEDILLLGKLTGRDLSYWN